jgi:nicotinate-nucleotide pyrophosphorylase (carboxylating)
LNLPNGGFLRNLDIDSIIEFALAEDLGDRGDITSKALFANARGDAIIKSKESGVLSGVSLLEPLFHKIDPDCTIEIRNQDGARLMPGGEICYLSGVLRSILAGERIALNFLQRLSAIATQTDALASLIKEYPAVLLDTRKTTPLLRELEKKAVRDGGGANHRFGLFDMILIKDTHVKGAGGPGPAVRKAKQYAAAMPDVKIEVEVQSVEEFLEAARELPDRIMLDNMNCEDMARCVRHAREQEFAIELEASGNVRAETIRGIAGTGVDFISVGAITHSVRAVDIHLKLL